MANLRARCTVLLVVNADRDADELSDEKLLARVARGDRVAFAELYDRTSPWLAARLRRRCHNPGQVEEILQDTYLAVWRAAGGYSGSGAAVGWIWTIARNRLVELARRERSQDRLTEDDDSRLPASPSAEQLALTDHYGARVESALATLSPELRTVLQATVLDGMSVRETAAWLGIPEATVKTRAFRARRQLRRVLS